MIDASELAHIASIVEQAGNRHLGGLPLSESGPMEVAKEDGSVVTSVDLALQESISAALHKQWPEVEFLGEEMSHTRQVEILHSNSSRVWVLDPLDGTTNFVAGFPFYGISLALVENDQAIAGVIYDPVRRELFCARKGHGVTMNAHPLVSKPVAHRLSRCVANVDYKRLTVDLAKRLVRSPPYRSQRNLGSCVLEWCWLAAGRFQLYLHGGEKLWDYAAGSLILQEAGGMAQTFEGQPVDCMGLNKKSVVAACTPELFQLWQAWIRREGGMAGLGISPA